MHTLFEIKILFHIDKTTHKFDIFGTQNIKIAQKTVVRYLTIKFCLYFVVFSLICLYKSTNSLRISEQNRERALTHNIKIKGKIIDSCCKNNTFRDNPFTIVLL